MSIEETKPMRNFRRHLRRCLIVVAVPVIVVAAAAVSKEARAKDLSCKENFWGETVCRPLRYTIKTDIWGETVCRPLRYTIKTDIWGDEVVSENGKVVARCKTNIFGTEVCRGTQR